MIPFSVVIIIFLLFVCCVPQLYLWGSPLLGAIFAYVTFFFFFLNRLVGLVVKASASRAGGPGFESR